MPQREENKTLDQMSSHQSVGNKKEMLLPTQPRISKPCLEQITRTVTTSVIATLQQSGILPNPQPDNNDTNVTKKLKKQ